jgi:hypothetical protein
MLNGFTQNLVATGGVEGFFVLCFAMFIGHALADYPLQGAFLASGKNRNGDSSVFFSGSMVPKGFWIHALTAHSLIQAGAVWLITGSAALGLVEFIVHWIIDFIRCDDMISFTTDQILHFLCKVVYAALLVQGVEMPF